MKLIKSMKGYLQVKKANQLKVVFYSESKSYYVNFKDIINELIKNKIEVYYITSSADDKVLKMENEYFKPVYIGSTFFVILFFNYLKANILITTLPDIDTFYLKRSKNTKHMIYVHHSMASMNMIYLPQAFESYDTIFCTGPYHELETREMEAEYNTKHKALVKAGYPALDDFINQYEEYCKSHISASNNKTVITIAPSWQKDNIIDSCIDELITSLLENGYIVKLRPHPETLKYEKSKIDSIVNIYKNNKNFILDNSPGNFESYLETDVMITDWSFTVYKYTFTTFKPVVFINTPIKVRNNNYKNYKNIPVDISWRREVGVEVGMDDIRNIGSIIKEVLANRHLLGDKIRAFRAQNIYNIGKSGKICADYIKELLENKNE